MEVLVNYLDEDRARVVQAFLDAMKQECGCSRGGCSSAAKECEVPDEAHERIEQFREEIRVVLRSWSSEVPGEVKDEFRQVVRRVRRERSD